MSFLRGFPADQLDSSLDLAYIDCKFAGNPSISAGSTPPGFTGKSINCPINHGVLHRLPSDQAGNTLHILVALYITSVYSGVLMSLNSSFNMGGLSSVQFQFRYWVLSGACLCGFASYLARFNFGGENVFRWLAI